MLCSPQKKRAFSLVELSIVLVILGLLVGGILTGRSLIRASELRAMTAETQAYLVAFKTFKDKYFYAAGDLPNATAFWGKDAALCNADTGTAATPGTCNGNGDGIIQHAVAANVKGETFAIWQHLSRAGLINGTYSGAAGAISAYDHVAGTNSPTSRLRKGAWGAHPISSYFAGDASAYAGDYGNAIIFGASATWGAAPFEPLLWPEEAWNIDTKVDDGMPGTGKLIARFWNNLCATSTTNTDYAGTYKLTETRPRCAFYIRNYF